jgi:hypothetical protein
MGDKLTDHQQKMLDKHKDTICENISAGKSLRSICTEHKISHRGVFIWLRVDEEFRKQYARARKEQADTLFDEILEIVDGADDPDVQSRRLRMDARKWMAGKMRPKKYGDTIQQKISGPDGEKLEVNPSEKLTELLSGIAKRSGKTS